MRSGGHKSTASYQRRAIAPLVAHYQVDMRKVPKATAAELSQSAQAQTWPSHLMSSPEHYAAMKAAAAHDPNAPRAAHPFPRPSQAPGANAPGAPNTPTATTNFIGIPQSSDFAPPGMALAVSPNWVFQGVNSFFSLYDTSGQQQFQLWPKSAQKFFSVLNLKKNCDTRTNPPSNAPFLSDPRAFYDPTDNRFWAAILQAEGVPGPDSPTATCPHLSMYYIAVSAPGDPNGLWNMYTFDMNQNGSSDPYYADFTQLGLDSQASYWSGNMYDSHTGTIQYAENFEGNKLLMEEGMPKPFTADGFIGLNYTGSRSTINVDTVQPVLTEAGSGPGPRAEFLVSTFNTNGDGSGNACHVVPVVGLQPCDGYVAWAFSNPIAHDNGGDTPTLTGTLIQTATAYELAPQADQPGCTACIDTDDTRVTATPVWRGGFVTLAWDTGFNNGTPTAPHIVPGIQWSQARLVLTDSDLTNCHSFNDVCADMSSASSEVQGGIVGFSGDGAAAYGAIMPDAGNDLFMVYEYMDQSTNPQIRYTARRATKATGTFEDSGNVLKPSAVAYGASCSSQTVCRWGDYEAVSYDGVSTDNVWFAGEYVLAQHVWGTWIGKDQFTLSTP